MKSIPIDLLAATNIETTVSNLSEEFWGHPSQQLYLKPEINLQKAILKKKWSEQWSKAVVSSNKIPKLSYEEMKRLPGRIKHNQNPSEIIRMFEVLLAQNIP